MNFLTKIKNNQEKVKTVSVFILAFLIPFLTILFVYKSLGMSPFGDKSVLIMDMSGQNIGFISEFRHIVQGSSSIFFSWSKSFGCNYVGTFAFFGSSPLSLFTLFFSNVDLPIAILWLTCIKIGLAGCSLSIYLKYAFNKCGITTLILSLCYALMSYTSVYSLSIMWLDALVWLPIILLGIEKLLQGKFPWILTVSFGIMFFSNYYTSYMIGIFSVLYFVLRYFGEKRSYLHELKYFLSFVASVLLAAGLNAWLLIPTGLDLFVGKLAKGGAEAMSGTYFGLEEFLYKLLPGQYDTITTGGLPSVFCGTFVVVFSMLYFFVPRILWRERILSFGILCFLTASLMSKQLDFMWHGFQYPNWFPFRYAFVFSAFLVFLAFRAVFTIPFREILGKVLKKKKVLDRVSYIGLAALLCFQTYELYGNSKVAMNGLDGEFQYKTLESYQSFYNKVSPLVKYAEEDDDFFRMEKNFERSKNDSMTFGYKGVSHYSSAYNAQVNSFTKQLGFAQGYFWNSYVGNTPLTDMIFNMKYIMSEKAMPASYELVKQSENAGLYEAPYILPVAYMAKDISPITRWSFDAQNEMLSRLSGLEANFFEGCEANYLEYNRYTFTAAKTAPYFIYVPVTNYGWGDVYVNDAFIDNYFSDEKTSILYIGDFTEGETVNVYFESSVEAAGMSVCSLDMDRLGQAYDILEKGGLQVEEYGNTFISGSVEAEESGSMMVSIPYDKGFEVSVDGERVGTKKAFDTFLSFDVNAGEHVIDIRYTAPGYTVGMIIAILSALICIAAIFFRHWIKERIFQLKTILCKAFYGVFTVVFVYLLVQIMFLTKSANYHKGWLFVFTMTGIILLTGSFFLLKHFSRWVKNYYPIILGSFSAVFFVVQLLIGFQLRFTPAYDMGAVYWGAVQWVQTGSFSEYYDYFCYFPNNLGGMSFLHVLFSFVDFLGISDYFAVAMVVNALLSAATVFVTSLVCCKLWGRVYGIWVLFFFVFSLPFYIIAPVFYTDSLSFLFPVLFYYLYLCFKDQTEGKYKLLFAALMGITLALGMLIKFTVVIVLVAVLIDVIFVNRYKGFLVISGASLFAAVILFGVMNANIYGNHLDKKTAHEMNTPYLHWIMMGLKGKGAYNHEDYEFTRSIPSQEVNLVLWDEINRRVRDLGPAGMFELWTNKAEICFGDGTLSLSDFLDDKPERKGGLHEWILYEGKYYKWYYLITTGMLLAAYFMMILGSAFELSVRRKLSRYQLTPQLAVFGIFLFLLMWETNVRYFTNYIPLIFVSATYAGNSLYTLRKKVKRLVRKGRTE